MRWSLVVAVTLIGAASSAGAQQPGQPAAPPKKVAVRAGQMIDPVKGAVVKNAVVLIEGDRITASGSNLAVPSGTEVIDLGSGTLLPGLIDAHTHLTSQPSGDYYADRFRRSPIDEAVSAHIYARRTLEAGFTTIRNVGAREYIDIALRNAINRGEVVGPRMLASAIPITATGGHGDLTGYSPYLQLEQLSGVADGVDEIRKAVRTRVKYGADLIKVLATAGVLSEEESAGAPQFSQEELNVLVEEAAMWGRKVAAHAHGAEGIKRAIKAGVASVEHASLIDDEGIQLAKEHGTYLVMDVYNDDYIMGEYARLGFPQKMLDKERQIGRLQRENFKKAVQAGVKMAFGTDAGVYPHGWNAKQFAKMVEWGMTPMQAIQAATVNAADLLGWSEKVGSLEPGHYADLVAVRGEPLKNVAELERMQFVMKGGVVYRAWPNAMAGKAAPVAPGGK